VTHDQALRATRNRFTRRAAAAAVVAAGAFVIAVAALVAVAVYFDRASASGSQWVSYLAVAAAVVIIGIRAYARRMR